MFEVVLPRSEKTVLGEDGGSGEKTVPEEDGGLGTP